ncbi:phytoene desaturase [Paenalkalicoccus suaedae]|uniref:Phytoene desaturase n=1 Tax=Paenalkalicoccus suaedae TaxID=2592382 RepID=A0A859FD59_9BACI|nr:phytoene desaturase family protein [Paenalkalicoccus suaedae]QKS71007.1 phytoene desaturase [Paenalkalicoccus suaedae]
MKTAIIGGGIGGLVTALYEVLDGNDVTIFEQRDKLGGRLSYHQQGAYKVDEGPTIVLLPEMITSILEQIGITEDDIQFERIDPVYPLHYKDGMTFLKWSNKEKQMEEMTRLFPQDVEAYKQYIKDMNDRFTVGKPAFLDRAFIDKKTFWTKSNVKTLVKLKAYQTVRQQVKKYFESERLQESFALQTLYIGGAPEQTPAIYSLVSFSEHEHGVWYVKGGYARLAEVLAEAVEKHGITVHLNTKVDELVVDEQEAVGVRIENTLYSFDRFVLNGDFPNMEGLVRKQKKRAYNPSSGCLLMYMGLNEPLATEHVHQFYMGDRLDEHMKQLFDEQRVPTDPSFYVFNPSLIDSTLAPKGHGVAYVLVPVPSASKVTKEQLYQLGEEMMERLEQRVDPAIRSKIVWKHVRTPHDQQLEGLFDGGSFGIAPTLFQSGVFRPQIKPFSLQNVYAVGASVHPGGGIPIVMQGAKLLADLLQEEKVAQKATK